MNDAENFHPPVTLEAMEKETGALGFSMAAERKTGALLRTLAVAKLASLFLELGTGTGLSTAWISDGMDQNSRLITLDNDESVTTIAQRHLGYDSRVTFYTVNGSVFLETSPGKNLHIFLPIPGQGSIMI